jgi:hypothetical protein
VEKPEKKKPRTASEIEAEQIQNVIKHADFSQPPSDEDDRSAAKALSLQLRSTARQLESLPLLIIDNLAAEIATLTEAVVTFNTAIRANMDPVR